MADHLLLNAISYIFQWPHQFVKRPVIREVRVSEKIILYNHKNAYTKLKHNLLCIPLFFHKTSKMLRYAVYVFCEKEDILSDPFVSNFGSLVM